MSASHLGRRKRLQADVFSGDLLMGNSELGSRGEDIWLGLCKMPSVCKAVS